MAPLQSRLKAFAENHPNGIVLIVIGLLLLYGAVGGYTVNKLGDYASDNRNLIKRLEQVQHRQDNQQLRFAHDTCTASNDAKTVVLNLLLAAQAATKADPKATAEEKAQAQVFYSAQLKQIRESIIDCPPKPPKES